MSVLAFFTLKTSNPFVLFSISHIVMLLIFGFLSVMLFSYREAIRKKKKIYRYILIGILLLCEISLYTWYSVTGIWDPYDTLPLQLCSISLLLCIFMLIMNSYRVFEITYFLGLAGAIQALLTPELFYDFPHYRYFHFFIGHIAIMLSCLYMVWIEKYEPTFKSIWRALIVLNILAIFVFFVNKWTGGNYMFLARKPSNPSLLDYLGPYPYYILTLEAAAVFFFTLLYLPFWLKEKRTRS
ncbi:TIGR02206 family membrane protein [Bacillus mesophilus]|uniref:TIGR02206 family membrane protein n=1 Tax=Bacillus mesophilus TaxID=1808955 RepID=A0A6M0Q6C4_9BACI|nr:TIGR02206 family membrane protein [Bacillus mesophilus]